MHAETSKASDRIVIGWGWTLCAILVTHFVATTIYVSPHNGLRLSLLPIVAPWIEPVFHQQWTLFAPDPLKSTDYLLVQCLIATGSEPDSPTTTTELVDVSAPLYHHHQGHRLGPTGYILRAQAYPLFLFAGKKSELVEYLLEDHDDSNAQVADLAAKVKAAGEASHTEALARIARIGSVECAHMHPKQIVKKVRVVWKSDTAPPFSKRHRPASEGTAEYSDFDWQDYAEVAPWR